MVLSLRDVLTRVTSNRNVYKSLSHEAKSRLKDLLPKEKLVLTCDVEGHHGAKPASPARQKLIDEAFKRAYSTTHPKTHGLCLTISTVRGLSTHSLKFLPVAYTPGELRMRPGYTHLFISFLHRLCPIR